MMQVETKAWLFKLPLSSIKKFTCFQALLLNHTSKPVWNSYRQVLSNPFSILFSTQLMAPQEGQEEH